MYEDVAEEMEDSDYGDESKKEESIAPKTMSGGGSASVFVRKNFPETWLWQWVTVRSVRTFQEKHNNYTHHSFFQLSFSSQVTTFVKYCGFFPNIP